MLFIKKNAITLIKWLSIILLIGALSGMIGTLFVKTISYVTELRTQNVWLILLLPFGGIVSVFIYKSLKISGMGTNHVLKSADGKNVLSPLLLPAIFICSAISHLFGASVGREGAALQLGGSTATIFGKIFKLNSSQNNILIYCGMAGLFSAVFGTPLAAFAFSLEVVCVGSICINAIIPTLLTSIIAFFVAVNFGTHPERFALTGIPDITFKVILQTVVIALLSALLSILFCYSLKYSEKFSKKLFKNDFLRIFVGGLIILSLTVIIGTQDYNGAGVNIIEQIFFDNRLNPAAFILKMIFTSVAVGTGYKGGEIVPTLFIGATFGGTIALIMGLSPAFGAAIGMTAMFCGVTNCPVASLLLAIEMFSAKGIAYIVLTVLLSFAASGKISLYSAQKRKSFKKECSI